MVADVARSVVHNGKRVIELHRRVGARDVLTILAASIDDRYLRRFDRKYRIRTSGFIELDQTSFERTRLRQATNYGAVNGWAFRRLLQELALPKQFAFTDLGSGLGRACILAAEYGFERVTGVELAAEFCATARSNIASCRTASGLSPINILQMDVLDYVETATDDVYFMYKPFAHDFFRQVLARLVARATALNKPVVVIFTERVGMPISFAPALTDDPAYQRMLEVVHWAQAFWVYRCGPSSIAI
jgi:SAM-dependent methyltransferase